MDSGRRHVAPPAGNGIRADASVRRFIRATMGRSALAAAVVFSFAGSRATDVTSAGVCVPQPGSNVGCEFYAVSLPNLLLDQALFEFGLVVTNAGMTPIDVDVSGGALTAPITRHVDRDSAASVALPWVDTISRSKATDRIAGGAYRIVSTGAAVAIQLNPAPKVIGGLPASAADASLLLPVSSAGTAFHIVVWPGWKPDHAADAYPAHVAVVATADDTVVHVDAPGTLEPGVGLDATGGSVDLDRGDVLLLSGELDSASDLTGSRITSSAPVIVWAGHGATEIPSGIPFADHTEEIVPPDTALDTDYLVARPVDASGDGVGSRVFVRVLATADGTTIELDPTVPGVPATLDENAVITFETPSDLRLHASHPVAVALFMEGSEATATGAGDPSQSVALAAHQLKSSFDFAAPLKAAPATLDLVAPTGAHVIVDAAGVTGWTPIGNSGWSVAHVALCCSMSHHASGDQPFTGAVHAYPDGSSASYWYPATLGIDGAFFRDGFEPGTSSEVAR